MAKCRAPRKNAKRPPRRPRADDHDGELTELVSVLAEYTLDNSAYGWFRPPWRDGWNAVELATMVAEIDAHERVGIDAGEEIRWLKTACALRDSSSSVYWDSQEHFLHSPTKLIRAALRCLQALIAKSDGGGEVYSAILVGPFSEMIPEDIYDLVLEYRCRDSIGTTAQLQSDADDRNRRAFTIAWRRGLYLAAYSLPPIAKPVGKLTIIKDEK